MLNFFECVELASVRHRLMTEMTGTSSSPCGYPFPTTVQSRTFCDRRVFDFLLLLSSSTESQPELPTESPPEPPATRAVFSQPAINLATCTIIGFLSPPPN